MAIVNMIDNNREEFPEGAYCDLSYSKPSTDGRRQVIVLYESHNGRCISKREQNGRDDSDFYMLVWNEEKGAAESIMFATTRGWSYPCLGSRVDATPDTLAKYEAWRTKAQAERAAQTERERLAYEAKMPSIGKRIRVIAGRKIAKGTEAEVFWFGKKRDFGVYPRNGYKSHGREMHAFARSLAPYAFDPRQDMRVGLVVNGEKVFTDATNVEVI